MAAVQWPGRLQKLQDSPAVYLDGAVNRASAHSVVESLQSRWTHPLLSIVAVPDDKDYAGVYAELGPVSDALILTDTDRNPILKFPDQHTALAAAREHNANARYAASLENAIQQAEALAGKQGTILIVGTQSIVADVTLRWGYTYEEI
jgi:dihydrofolate synthase/folylpolyglutamate synthase